MNHGSSISRAGFLDATHVYGLSHDETFSVSELETDSEGSNLEVPLPLKGFGDLRTRLKCNYVVDVIASTGFGESEAIVGAGSHIKRGEERLDLHFLSSSPDWSFKSKNRIRLPGAHGDDVIRSFGLHPLVNSP